jgi:hypothetical protein
MPELARGEWEHLFEPWFVDEAPYSPSPQTRTGDPDSLFSEASQPLAVRRKDFVERQSPISRALELRGANVAMEMERLVAYAERRHVVVEPLGGAGPVERPPLRDAPLPRLELHGAQSQLPSTGIRHTDRSAKARRDPHRPGSSPFRALLTFASIVLVAAYVVYVQRSASAAMSRAAAAEHSAAELQRTANEALAAASDRAQRAISEALTHASRAERMIQVMAAPDARRIELSGSAAAPAAAGQALYSRSRGVILSATDLPRPEEGHVFQVWATTSAGSVSLGLAAPDAQGRLAAAYDLPPALAGSIRGFLVTAERAGGSASPGVAVLANR